MSSSNADSNYRASAKLRIAMVGPTRDRCGVADYTAHIVHALREIAEVPYLVDSSLFNPEMNSVDVIHIQHQYFLFGGVAPWKNRFTVFSRSLVAPAVMTVHEFVSPGGSAAHRAAIRTTNRAQFRSPRIRRVIVHTSADRVRLAEAGVAPDRIALIRHAVPLIGELPSREASRAALGLEGRFVIAILGFISRKKGYRAAVESLRNLPQEVVLLIAGGAHPDDSTDYLSEVRKLTETHGLQARVRLTGYLEREALLGALSAADLVLAPYSESSGSGSLALALGARKPVLASDIPPHLELLAEGPGAMATFPLGEPNSLAARILELKSDPAALAVLGEYAGQYADAHPYSRAARETVELYRAVLAQRSE